MERTKKRLLNGARENMKAKQTKMKQKTGRERQSTARR